MTRIMKSQDGGTAFDMLPRGFEMSPSQKESETMDEWMSSSLLTLSKCPTICTPKQPRVQSKSSRHAYDKTRP